MIKASSRFDHEDRRRVEAAVAEAERSTCGEIVPVVATASGRYDRAEDLFGLLLGLASLAVVWAICQDVVETPWAPSPTPALGLSWIIGILVAGFVVGAALATRFPMLRLPLVPRGEMREEVEHRALEAFQRHRVRTTAGGTGVLIYVSLYERMVRVVGDDAIAAKLTSQDWQAVCDLVVAGMKTGRATEGLEAGIRKAGELLSRHFPIRPDDVDELPNTLVLID